MAHHAAHRPRRSGAAPRSVEPVRAATGRAPTVAAHWPDHTTAEGGRVITWLLEDVLGGIVRLLGRSPSKRRGRRGRPSSRG
jgi:hypothetical protein